MALDMSVSLGEKIVRTPAKKEEKGRRSWDDGPWGCCYFHRAGRNLRDAYSGVS